MQPRHLHASNNITLVLLAVGGGDPELRAARRLVAHLAGSSSRPLDVHLATSGGRHPAAPPSWRQHMLESLPEAAQALHERYTKLTHGPGSVYMYKPLLHHLLPPSMDRALVLDTDLYLPSRAFDLAGLWDEFEAFPPEAALGLALEQQPTYEHLGGGVNGGVQLLHLARMRTHRGAYARELERCATGACGDIGYLGDQTFYSAAWRRTPSLFYSVPCGWNRQLSDNAYHHPVPSQPEPCAPLLRL